MNKEKRIPDEVIKEIKSKIDIVSFISRETELKRIGNTYKGVCTKCNKHSLTVYPETKSYYCFSCSKGGDVIAYIKDTKNIGYKDAVSVALSQIEDDRIKKRKTAGNEKLVERAKMYLKLLSDGVHPVTGIELTQDSVFLDEKVKKCFSFISQILDDYIELSSKIEFEGAFNQEFSEDYLNNFKTKDN